MSRCSECAGSVIWNEDAGSNICTSCGTLTDPTQRVFADSNDPADSQYFNPSAPNSLKRFRGGSSWNLAGQSKETTARNNTFTIHAFIKSLTLTLSVPGLSPRVCTLFDQAMQTMQFRWGTKAKMVAGACLSIALRETGRPDFLKDIAFLSEQNDISVKRTLSSVLTALKITLTPTGPTQYLPTLQSHISSILQSSAESSGINVFLYSELKSLSLQSAIETAHLFIDTLARFAFETTLSQLSNAAVACAVFILSLEAEKRSPFSHLTDISASFANRCQVSKVLVMQRYQVLQDNIAKWIEEVEWLDSYQKRGRRSKVSKRLLCARGLKDALNWKQVLWKKQIEVEGKLILDVHMNGVDSDPNSEGESSLDVHAGSASLRSKDRLPSRKRKRVHSAVTGATHFLLNPLDASVSSRAGSSTSRTKTPPDTSTMSSYLISIPSFTDVRTLPSRLQQLSIARGGADVDVILDDELLAEGEWEAMQRTPEEMQELEQRWREEGVFDAIEKAKLTAALNNDKRVQAKGVHAGSESLVSAGPIPTSKRINLDALSEFMCYGDPDAYQFLGLEVLEDDKDDKESDVDGYGVMYDTSTSASYPDSAGGDEITIDDWRPLSPGFDNSFDDYL